MFILSWFRNRRLSHQNLQELYRSSEQGTPLPEVDSEAQVQFEADQRIIDQLSGLASSASPRDVSQQRGALLSRVAKEREARVADERVPMLIRGIPKRTVVLAGAAAILMAAAATVGATGSVGDVTDNVNDVLEAVQITKPHKVEVCHVPSDNPENSHTISIAKKALEEHLAHGDSEGPCAEGLTTADEGGNSGKVDVCHGSADNPDKAKTISVGANAVDEHLAHGDSEGACAETGAVAPADEVGTSGKTDVCHGSSDNPENSHTISIAKKALEEHLAHGDSEGPCADETPEG